MKITPKGMFAYLQMQFNNSANTVPHCAPHTHQGNRVSRLIMRLYLLNIPGNRVKTIELYTRQLSTASSGRIIPQANSALPGESRSSAPRLVRSIGSTPKANILCLWCCLLLLPLLLMAYALYSKGREKKEGQSFWQRTRFGSARIEATPVPRGHRDHSVPSATEYLLSITL